MLPLIHKLTTTLVAQGQLEQGQGEGQGRGQGQAEGQDPAERRGGHRQVPADGNYRSQLRVQHHRRGCKIGLPGYCCLLVALLTINQLINQIINELIIRLISMNANKINDSNYVIYAITDCILYICITV